MEKSQLRDALVHELWRMTKMDIIAHLREFVEGETAALYYLNNCGSETLTPTQISEYLQVSRARAANILRSLRGKGYVRMDIAEDDRRKMDVTITDAGRKAMEDKYNFLLRYFELYIDVLGEEDVADLTRLLKKTVDCNLLLDPERAREKTEEEVR